MIRQPYNSKLCGHYCMAAALRITVSEAISLIGHTNGTRTKEIAKHLKLGKIRKGEPTVKALCISRKKGKATGGWHWVLFTGKQIYEPHLGPGMLISIETYSAMGMVITSHYPIIQ